ncbi:MAG: hypothetical protein ACE14S_04200 [Candidatus Bathyarchaeia archaeon]
MNYRGFLGKLSSAPAILLAGILTSATFLRVWLLDSWLPMFVDEASLLVPSFSFKVTNSLFSVAAWQRGGVYQLYSLAFYFSEKPDVVLIVARLLYAALPGIAAVLVSYFVFKEFYGKSVALLSAFFMSINAFHILYSRIAVLYSYSLFMYMLIFYFFSKGLRTGRKLFFLPALMLLLLAIQISMPTIEFCIFLLLAFSIMHFFQHRREMKFFSLKVLKSRSVLVLLILSAAALVFFSLIGTIPFFLGTIGNLPPPETGFDKMFGFGSFANLSYSIVHIADYMIRMNTLPIVLLAVAGLAYSVYKKDVLVLSWSLSLVPGFIYGYYSRRVLFSVPLIMLLSSITILAIWHKIPKVAIGLKEAFKIKANSGRLLKGVGVAFVVVLSLTAFFESFTYVSDLPYSNAPSIEKEIYVSRYTSGYGVKETVDYIKSISDNGLIITDTPLLFRYYFLNYANSYEVVDLGTVEMSRNSLLNLLQRSEKPVFFSIRWWNWVNDFFSNLTRDEPGYPLSLIKTFEIPASTIDNTTSVYATGNHSVWSTSDASFNNPTEWEFNTSKVWRKFVLGWPEHMSMYYQARAYDGSLQMVIKGNSSWAWTSMGIMQENPHYSDGNLTYNPIVNIEVNLEEQAPGSYLRFQLDLSSNQEYRNMVYVNSYLNYNFPSNVFKNSSSTVYFIRKMPLNTWTTVSIDVKKDYDSYFSDGNYGYGLSLVKIGASACNGTLNSHIRNAEIKYNCSPWSLAIQ